MSIYNVRNLKLVSLMNHLYHYVSLEAELGFFLNPRITVDKTKVETLELRFPILLLS